MREVTFNIGDVNTFKTDTLATKVAKNADVTVNGRNYKDRTYSCELGKFTRLIYLVKALVVTLFTGGIALFWEKARNLWTDGFSGKESVRVLQEIKVKTPTPTPPTSPKSTPPQSPHSTPPSSPKSTPPTTPRNKPEGPTSTSDDKDTPDDLLKSSIGPEDAKILDTFLGYHTKSEGQLKTWISMLTKRDEPKAFLSSGHYNMILGNKDEAQKNFEAAKKDSEAVAKYLTKLETALAHLSDQENADKFRSIAEEMIGLLKV